MTATTDLHQALVEWRRLAEAEGRAIRAGNWPFVAECQDALARLREAIDKLVGNSAGNGRSPAPHSFTEKPSQRSAVLDLIELQQRNLAALQQRRRKLSDHVQQLNRSSRNLRGIQRTYAPASPAGWSSYS